MVLALRRAQPLTDAQRERILGQVRALKDLFGVRTQYLESLFAADGQIATDPVLAGR